MDYKKRICEMLNYLESDQLKIIFYAIKKMINL